MALKTEIFRILGKKKERETSRKGGATQRVVYQILCIWITAILFNPRGSCKRYHNFVQRCLILLRKNWHIIADITPTSAFLFETS